MNGENSPPRSASADADDAKTDGTPRELDPALEVFLCKNRSWVASGGIHGRQLKSTDLPQEGFSGRHLPGVDFRDAPLRGVNFTGAYLCDADFRGADLREADFTNVKGLLPSNLAGANLAGTTLPANIDTFGDLRSLDEASKNARTLFITTLGACIYSWLTIATTTDAALLVNNVASPLPVVSALIPIVTFYYFSPVVLLCLHVYFLFCLQVVWNLLAKLPAVFPDGVPLERKSFPWLITDLVLFHFRHLRRNVTILSYTQRVLSVFLAWYLIPLTLLMFWFRYLPARDLRGTLWQASIITLSVFFAISLHTLALATLRFAPTRHGPASRTQQPWRGLWAFLKNNGIAIRILAAVAVAGGLYYLSTGVIHGKWRDERELANMPRQDRKGVTTLLRRRTFVPWLATQLGISRRLKPNLAYLDVSTKPASWTGGDAQIDSVKGANLSFRDLSFGDCYEAFAANARFVGADLRGAKFGHSDLRKGDFSRVIGNEANFTRARLGKARFGGATMRRTKFYGAKLDGTIFTSDFLRARLTGAKTARSMLGFSSSDFSESDFTYAELDECDFRSTFLRESRFLVARLQATDFTGADLRDAYFTGASISNCSFGHTKLSGSSFDRATLKSVSFDNAELADPTRILVAVFSNTTIIAVDFSNAINVKLAVFTGAVYDESTKWPDDFTPPGATKIPSATLQGPQPAP